MPKDPVRFYEYAGCSTCKKAKKWLLANEVRFDSIPIVERPPSSRELGELVVASGLPIAKWFNTSGQSYRALVARVGKQGLDQMSDRDKLALLAKDGKLIKRPVVVAGSAVLLGFREEQYAERLTRR
jgi:Spx/MgsR family transcriptional regulator